MKLLLLNPNTSEAVTHHIAAVARAVARSGTEIVAVTASFGPHYIASRAGSAIAAHATLDAIADHIGTQNPAGYHAIVLGCFGDPGIDAAREICPIPVIGLAEAAIEAAVDLPGRFAIVTTGSPWVSMLTELVQANGYRDRLSTIQALPETGLQALTSPNATTARIISLVQRCHSEFAAASVILGGAGLAGLSDLIRSSIPVPALDPIACAIRRAEAGLGPLNARQASRFVVSSTSTGLSLPLARVLACGERQAAMPGTASASRKRY